MTRLSKSTREWLRNQERKEREFFRANPLWAAHWILPGIAALVAIEGPSPAVIRKSIRELRLMPVPAWALRQAIREVRDLANQNIQPRSREEAAQIRQNLDAAARIPDTFWEKILPRLDQGPPDGTRET